MNRDLPRMSLSSAKVIKIICYDLSYVIARWGHFVLHTQTMSKCVQNFCITFVFIQC